MPHPQFLAVVLILVAALAAGLFAWRRRAARMARQFGEPAHDYAVRQDWTKSRGKVNYSTFIYFDVDRDGEYGLADRPMTGIAVRLSAPG